MSNPRWSAVVADEVAEQVLRFRDDETVLRRFFAKVDFALDLGGCELWTGAMSTEGYGDFALPREGGASRTVRAHRVRFIWAFGPPPAETPFLDHSRICIGRFCVNLEHLEPVDEAENQRRRTNFGKEGQRLARYLELQLRDERRAAGERDLF